MMVVMVERLFPINHALNVPELLHMARDGDGPLLIKPILFLGFLQQLHEQRVVEVYHRHHKSLLFLTLPDVNCQTPFWHVSDYLLLPSMMVVVMVMVMVMMEMQM